ncbi:MAG: hypothetical protein Hals2KO_14470 [Halioglobus sp.]
MKFVPTVGKVTALIFSAFLLAACSGSDTQEQDEAAARAAEEAAARAAAATVQQAEMQRLQEAAAAVGNLFYFEFDSSALTQDSINKLDAHIALLQQTERSIRLEGHADERGTRDYNMALGERRANSVRDYMVANGIANYRIETVSYGEERPLAYGSGEANWSQNRRVELK